MKTNLIIYAVCLLSSAFAVSGININPLIKKGHIWEARFFTFMLIVSLAYLTASFIISFINT